MNKVKKIKIGHLFSGIGSPEEALTNLQVPYEVEYFSEIYQPAITSYSLLHKVSTEKNLGDITKVNVENIPSVDLLVYGFPCQDISQLGLQKGIKKDQTRSGLVYHALEIIEKTQPKYLIMENVKALVGNKFINEFNHIKTIIEDFGYYNYHSVLNTKDYDIPQNRERVFMISVRKDLTHGFKFPPPKKNTKKLVDFLDLDLPYNDRYYLSEDKIRKIMVEKKSVFKERFNVKNVYKDTAACLTTKGGTHAITNTFILDCKGVRALTEKECCKLQGFKSEYVDLLTNNGVSLPSIYKMLGNTISVNVMEYILKELLLTKISSLQQNLFIELNEDVEVKDE